MMDNCMYHIQWDRDISRFRPDKLYNVRIKDLLKSYAPDTKKGPIKGNLELRGVRSTSADTNDDSEAKIVIQESDGTKVNKKTGKPLVSSTKVVSHKHQRGSDELQHEVQTNQVQQVEERRKENKDVKAAHIGTAHIEEPDEEKDNETLDLQNQKKKSEASEVHELKAKVEKLQEETEQIQQEMKNMKMQLVDQQKSRLRAAGPEVPLPCAVAAAASPPPPSQPEWIIPEVLYNDERLTEALRQLPRSVHGRLLITPLPSSQISASLHAGRVVIPVVVSTRVGDDLNRALNRAKISVPAIVLIFNHLAPHNSRIRYPTKERLTHLNLGDSCQDILDLVFWNRSMYDCQANKNATEKLKGMLQI